MAAGRQKKADMCHGRQTVVAHGHLMARSASKQKLYKGKLK